jgi:hypothetical protein
LREWQLLYEDLDLSSQRRGISPLSALVASFTIRADAPESQTPAKDICCRSGIDRSDCGGDLYSWDFEIARQHPSHSKTNSV